MRIQKLSDLVLSVLFLADHAFQKIKVRPYTALPAMVWLIISQKIFTTSRLKVNHMEFARTLALMAPMISITQQLIKVSVKNAISNALHAKMRRLPAPAAKIPYSLMFRLSNVYNFALMEHTNIPIIPIAIRVRNLA